MSLFILSLFFTTTSDEYGIYSLWWYNNGLELLPSLSLHALFITNQRCFVTIRKVKTFYRGDNDGWQQYINLWVFCFCFVFVSVCLLLFCFIFFFFYLFWDIIYLLLYLYLRKSILKIVLYYTDIWNNTT